MDTFKYILTLADIKEKFPTSSWVRITTITMISKLGQEIDLEAFRAKFVPCHLRPKGSSAKGFEWTMKKTTFYNQVTIGYRDPYSQKSVKLFPNGSVQVAGCSDMFDCERILRQVAFIVSRTLEVPINAAHLIASMSVKMINTNFSLNSSVNLNKVIQRFSRHAEFRVSFDPDRYSAVKVKFQPGPDTKQVTASIFSTGKIIVTGAQTLREIAMAFHILNTHLMGDVRIAPTEKKDEFGVILGHPFKTIVPVLRAKGFFSWPTVNVYATGHG
jgi:TATA-box binding protein (TBP) (component of TFIID and TFIIIB)